MTNFFNNLINFCDEEGLEKPLKNITVFNGENHIIYTIKLACEDKIVEFDKKCNCVQIAKNEASRMMIKKLENVKYRKKLSPYGELNNFAIQNNVPPPIFEEIPQKRKSINPLFRHIIKVKLEGYEELAKGPSIQTAKNLAAKKILEKLNIEVDEITPPLPITYENPNSVLMGVCRRNSLSCPSYTKLYIERLHRFDCVVNLSFKDPIDKKIKIKKSWNSFGEDEKREIAKKKAAKSMLHLLENDELIHYDNDEKIFTQINNNKSINNINQSVNNINQSVNNINQSVNNINKAISKLPIGLPNLGQTCYLNAVVQCLFSLDNFRNLILNSKITNDNVSMDIECDAMDLDEEDEESSNYELMLNNFKSLFNILTTTEMPPDTAKFFYATVPDSFSPKEPQEAYHYFSHVYNHLLKSSVGDSLKSKFHFTKIRVTECGECGMKNYINSNEFLFILNIPSSNYTLDIQKLFSTHVNSTEIINDYKCNYCEKISTAKSRIQAKSFPDILVIMISIFTFNFTKNQTEKISLRHCKNKLTDIYISNNVHYKLRSFIGHDGSQLNNGHYISYLYNYIDKNWCICNDSSVYIEDKMKHSGFTTDFTPYLLFFEKRVLKSING